MVVQRLGGRRLSAKARKKLRPARVSGPFLQHHRNKQQFLPTAGAVNHAIMGEACREDERLHFYRQAVSSVHPRTRQGDARRREGGSRRDGAACKSRKTRGCAASVSLVV